MTQILQSLMGGQMGGAQNPDGSGVPPAQSNPFMSLLTPNLQPGPGTIMGLLKSMGVLDPKPVNGAPAMIEPGSATSSAPVASAPQDTIPTPQPRPSTATSKQGEKPNINNPMSQATGFQILDESGKVINSGTFGAENAPVPKLSPYAQPSAIPPHAINQLREAMLAQIKGQK